MEGHWPAISGSQDILLATSGMPNFAAGIRAPIACASVSHSYKALPNSLLSKTIQFGPKLCQNCARIPFLCHSFLTES